MLLHRILLHKILSNVYLYYLFNSQDMATFKMTSLQKALDDSVPGSDLDLMNKRYHDLTEKYRDTLEKGNTLVSKAEALVGLEVRRGSKGHCTCSTC